MSWVWPAVVYGAREHTPNGIIALLNRRLPELARRVRLLFAGVTSVGTFAAADTTPSVTGASVWQCANTGATAITDFDGGVEGQRIIVKVDANTTIVHGAPIKLALGLPFVGTANDMISLVQLSGVWYETGRSVNG